MALTGKQMREPFTDKSSSAQYEYFHKHHTLLEEGSYLFG